MVAYADTSFLVSLYGQDANSAPAQEIAANINASLAFTPFLRHEARNAIRLALFRKEITADECEATAAKYLSRAKDNADRGKAFTALAAEIRKRRVATVGDLPDDVVKKIWK